MESGSAQAPAADDEKRNAAMEEEDGAPSRKRTAGENPVEGGDAKRARKKGPLADAGSHGASLPPDIVAYRVAPFAEDLDTLTALASTSRRIRELLVRRVAGVPIWHRVVKKRSTNLKQSDAAAVYAVSGAKLKRACPFREVEGFSRTHRRHYVTHYFSSADVFNTLALKPRRATKKKVPATLQVLLDARAESAKRSQAMAGAKETMVLRDQHSRGLEALLESAKLGKERVAARLPGDLASELNRARLAIQRDLQAAVNQRSAERVRALGEESWPLQHALDIAEAMEALEEMGARWRREDGEFKAQQEAESLCAGAASADQLFQVAHRVRGLEEEARNDLEQRGLFGPDDIRLPHANLLQHLRCEDAARSEDARKERVYAKMEAAGVDTDAESNLIGDFMRWRFHPNLGELCAEEVVAVRKLVDRTMEVNITPYLPKYPQHVLKKMRRYLDSSAKEHVGEHGQVWRPNAPELLHELLEAADTVFAEYKDKADAEGPVFEPWEDKAEVLWYDGFSMYGHY